MKVLTTDSRTDRHSGMRNRFRLARQSAGLVLALIGLTAMFVSLTSFQTDPALTKSASLTEGSPGWIATGRLNTARYSHTATLLANGQVLVAGGGIGGFCYCCCAPDKSSTSTSKAELYDPITATWRYTGSLNAARQGHSATLLSNGDVLVAGGITDINTLSPIKSAEVFDPATGIWRLVGSFNTIQSIHAATLLTNGKVLAVGHSSNGARYLAELYDPATESWSNTDSLSIGTGSNVSTVLLSNGKVLAVSGVSAELYDPATETWSRAGNPRTLWFYSQTMTLLGNGNILVTGFGNFFPAPLGAELFDTSEGKWRRTGFPNAARSDLGYGGSPTATLLANGRVLVAGGYSSWSNSNGEELYDPATETWSYTPRLKLARHNHTATLLSDHKVLVAGGVDEGTDQLTGPHDTAEVYDPNIASVTPRFTSATVSGKRLFVMGDNFDPGAVILLNGEPQITKNDPQNPKTSLIGKKAGKKIKSGDRLQVRNPDGALSEEFTYPGS